MWHLRYSDALDYGNYQFFLFTVGFDPTTYSVSEGGVVNFTIRRLTPATRTVSVIFNTVPDSATGMHKASLPFSLPPSLVHPFTPFPNVLYVLQTPK